MIRRLFLYIVLDSVIFVGGIISILRKDFEVLPLFVIALVVNVIHQMHTEKNYYKGMFDQGRPYLIKYGYPFFRWMVTIMAVALVGAFIGDYIVAF